MRSKEPDIFLIKALETKEAAESFASGKVILKDISYYSALELVPKDEGSKSEDSNRRGDKDENSISYINLDGKIYHISTGRSFVLCMHFGNDKILSEYGKFQVKIHSPERLFEEIKKTVYQHLPSQSGSALANLAKVSYVESKNIENYPTVPDIEKLDGSLLVNSDEKNGTAKIMRCVFIKDSQFEKDKEVRMSFPFNIDNARNIKDNSNFKLHFYKSITKEKYKEFENYTAWNDGMTKDGDDLYYSYSYYWIEARLRVCPSFFEVL